jgi:hypothetical protein
MGLDPSIFLDDLSEDLFCPICYDIYDTCYKTECKHNYCLFCLQLLLTTETQLCAFDRKKINYDSCIEELDVNERIGNLKTKCTIKDCNWIGMYKDLFLHEYNCSDKKKMIKEKNVYESTKPKLNKNLICGDKEITLKVFR